jgi:hypothetical protein
MPAERSPQRGKISAASIAGFLIEHSRGLHRQYFLFRAQLGGIDTGSKKLASQTFELPLVMAPLCERRVVNGAAHL